jgi:hypothetical protein
MSLFFDIAASSKASRENSRDRSHWLRPAAFDVIDPSEYPLPEHRHFDRAILLAYAKTKEGGHTEVDCVRVGGTVSIGPPLFRCDILNMTRHVHHHYEYAKDGHSRTYTMSVSENQTISSQIIDLSSHAKLLYSPSVNGNGVVLSAENKDDAILQLPLGVHPSLKRGILVQLYRDKDSFPIPYTSIYGITLISAIRLGLDPRIRDRYFGEFLNLSLYEDMAPWNIVLNGPSLSYIDYDTREITFDKELGKVNMALLYF